MSSAWSMVPKLEIQISTKYYSDIHIKEAQILSNFRALQGLYLVD